MRRIARLFAIGAETARTPSHSRRGQASLVLVSGLGAVALAAGAAGTWRVPDAEPGRPPRAPAVAAAVAPGDTVTIWGPRQFNGSSGQGQTYVEAFTATVTPGRLYTLHLVNGAPNGTQRASKVTVTLNGFQVVAQNEVTQSVALLDRVVAITAVDTIRVTVAGSGNPFITLSVLSSAPPEFFAYGPTQFAIPSGTTKTYNETYAIGGPHGTPKRVYVTNGAANGTQRVTSGSITLNGTTIVSTSELKNTVGSLTKTPVTMLSSGTLVITVNGPVNSFITVWFTAPDIAFPALTITTPAAGAAVPATSVSVTGTIQDQTPTTVTVNGIAATVTNNTSYTATLPLPAEGSHLLTVRATDLANHVSTVTRTVIRDTQTPVLVLSGPADGSGTRNSTITVSGTVGDATTVTVNTNGTPLPGNGGSFSGPVALAYGANVLTTSAVDLAGNTATDVRTVYRDTLPPVLAVSSPAGGSTVSSDSVLITGTVSDETPVTVAANGVTLPVSSGSFSKKVPLGVGSNVVLVSATDAVSNRSTVSRVVFRTGSIPPDPSTIAPPIDAGAATTMIAGVSFLFTGPNAIQTGVTAGAIKPLEVAVIKGTVLDRAGQPIAGAAISIMGHPEFGGTYSRANGAYDLAVNGGDPVTLSVVKPGFLPLQRSIKPQVQTFFGQEDVVLTPEDPNVTAIDFSQPTQVARGSLQSDADGTRRQVLVFKQGTQASMTLADGTVQPLGTIQVRATEYTVGNTGVGAMAGTLPATSGYTYAVEFSVDEARAAGASGVNFSQPVVSYVDNFLGFPVGTKVPAGYYDQKQGRWLSFDDGRVIKMLGVTGGRANLDVTGDGVADEGAALTALGIDDPERERIATEYAAGKELWRVPVTHFTPMDWNWPFGPIAGALAPFIKALTDFFDPTRDPFNECGSTIECETQALGEELPVTGTPFSLTYRSNRQVGGTGRTTLRLPLTPGTVSPDLLRVELEVSVAGQAFRSTFPGTANQTHFFNWDGRDAYGRALQAAQPARVRVGYVYPAVYQEPAQFAQSFAQFSGSATSLRTRREIVLWQELDAMVGGFDVAALGLGGWSLSAHHFYDPIRGVLYLGDGRRRDASVVNGTVATVVGTPGQAGFSGDGGPAAQAKLNAPGGIAVGPDGSIYISDFNNRRIRRVSPSGIITTVAGDGSACCSGEGGPATAAGIGNPQRLAVAPDGSILFGPYDGARVLKVTPDGVIRRVAGTGSAGFSGDGGPATTAQISRYAREVLPTPDGGFYLADWDNGRVRYVDPAGNIRTIAGGGSVLGDGGPATAARLVQPEGLLFGLDGALYVQDGGQRRIRRIGVDGIIRTVWGTGTAGSVGDGSPGTVAQITANAQGIDLGLDGSVYLADLDACRIRRLGTDGIVTTYAGSTCGLGGDGGPATQSKINHPFDVAVAPNGSVYIDDLDNHTVRLVTPAFPEFSGSDIAVASEDGTELYQFSAGGRHLRTLEARTGATLLEFGYNGSDGQVVTVTDADGNVTTIERDQQGIATGILAPFGQRTTLTMDGQEYLASVTDPAGNRVRLFHDGGGLLDSLADPRGKVHRYTYDSYGRLRRDEDPAGGFKELEAVDGDTNVSVTVTTALDRATTYVLQRLPTGATRRVATDPAGQSTTTVELPSGRDSTNLPDGTRVVVQKDADPRWGMQAPVATSITTRLPSGVTSTITGGRRATLGTAGDPLSLTSLTDSTIVNGELFKTVYTQAGRRFTSTSPEGRQQFTTVDAIGRVTVARTPGLDSVTYRYDNRGRLDRVQAGGRVTNYSYDPRGRLLSTLDPLGRRDSVFYDDADRMIRRVLPGGREVQFAYDSSGNLTSLMPPGRPAHGFRSTGVDLDSLYTPPDLGTGTWATRYRYNLDRQLIAIDRPDGVTVGLGYEASTGRPSTVTFDRGQSTYAYSSTTGQVTGLTAPGGLSLAYTYDGALPKTVTWGGAVMGSLGLTYNTDFRVSAQTVNGANSVAFGYDRDGLLTSAGALGIKRNSQHGLIERDSIGSVLAVTAYDPKAAWASYTVTQGASGLFQTSYARDSLGRITEVTEIIQGTTSTLAFSYDGAGRLFEVRRNGTLTATYEYDPNGNRERLTTPGGVVPASYDAQDRLIAYGTTTYTYTANGELRTKTVPGVGTTTYTYDALGNLTAVTLPDGTQLGYLIDGGNRRIGKTVNGTRVQGFLYQGALQPVAELNSSNQVVSRFVYGTRANVPEYLIKGGQTYRMVLDHLGSVRLVVNTTDGTVAQKIDYDEFGRVTQNTSPGFQPFGYAGGLLDDHTGLVRFGRRDYDPGSGRWTAKDPIGFGGGFTNLYEYVDNDPINFVDPAGLQRWGQVFGGTWTVYAGYGLVAWGATVSAPAIAGAAVVAGTFTMAVGAANVVAGAFDIPQRVPSGPGAFAGAVADASSNNWQGGFCPTGQGMGSYEAMGTVADVLSRLPAGLATARNFLEKMINRGTSPAGSPFTLPTPADFAKPTYTWPTR